MARRSKNTVDYFPHLIQEGKSMFIIESKYKNDGYATWFKILERLGKSENHFIDLSDDKEWMYLASKCNICDDLLESIISDLVQLKQFDRYLWEDHKVIWCQSFVDNIADVYKRRNSEMPTFNIICKHLNIKCKQEPMGGGLKSYKNPHSKVKDSKVKEIKGNKSKVKTGETSSLHVLCKNSFLEYYSELHKSEYYWTAKDATHLNQLIAKIKFKTKEVGIETTDNKIHEGFSIFIKAITDKWILQNFSIPNINSKFNECYGQIKKGSGKYYHSDEELRAAVSRSG